MTACGKTWIIAESTQSGGEANSVLQMPGCRGLAAIPPAGRKMTAPEVQLCRPLGKPQTYHISLAMMTDTFFKFYPTFLHDHVLLLVSEDPTSPSFTDLLSTDFVVSVYFSRNPINCLRMTWIGHPSPISSVLR